MEAEPVQPLDLLNRDEWIYILLCLHKPRDRWNTANAHPVFRSIFEKELKKEWLPTIFFASVPHLLNYLPLKNILELRLVDTGAKSAIDHYLNQGQVLVLKKIYFSPYNLTPNENGQGFHLITRAITSWMKLDIHVNQIQERFGDFVPFFRQHGPQVTNCWSMHGLQQQRAHPLETFTYFRNLLTYIPNVEDLVLMTNFSYPEDCCCADILTTYLSDNPLPCLSALKSFSFFLAGRSNCDPGSAFPIILGAFLQTYGTQLHELLLSTSTAIFPTSMPCLRYLNFHLESLEQLESLRDSAAPLRDLDVTIVPNSSIQLSQFFLALQPFQKTLRKLTLDARNWEFDKVGPLPVEFPQVKTLELTGCFFGCTGNDLGFLESFPNLVKLELDWVDMDDNGSEREIEDSRHSYLLEEEQFYRSSIWTRLQSLHSVEIIPYYGYMLGPKVYQRSTYEQVHPEKLAYNFVSSSFVYRVSFLQCNIA